MQGRMASTAGYSGTPLIKKLGIKPGMRCVALSAPADYADLLGPLPDGATLVTRLPREAAFVHAFFESTAALGARLPALEKALSRDGALWISWRKGKVTDLGEDAVRAAALAIGLVDVKVCAVDQTWSALKIVRRLSDR